VPDTIILVDNNDAEVGTMDKLEAHQKGLLHRAFSILILNDTGKILLQQRAANKYHSANLWTNSCCSHPRPGETVVQTGQRRLFEEMGINCDLKEIGSFLYKHRFENGLTEHEYDHVLIGTHEGDPMPNPVEVQDYKWISPKALKEEMQLNPAKFTYWFAKALKALEQNG